MQGQLSNEEFLSTYPNVKVNIHTGKATIGYGKNTINYWYQHEDGSWTNYDCKTIDQ